MKFCTLPRFLKEQDSPRILISVFALIVSGLFADFFNLVYNFINMEGISSVFIPSKLLSQPITAIIAAIIAVIFAVYILLIQLFRNRYPIDFIDAIFKRRISNISYNYILNIIIGILLLIIDKELAISKIIYILHVFYCIGLFCKLFQDYRVFNIKKSLNDYKSKVIYQLENNCIDYVSLNKCLDELGKYSEDSFIKGELYTAKYISYIYQDLALHFLENINKSVLKGALSSEEIEEIEKRIFISLLDQAKLSVHYDFKNYLRECYDIIHTILINTVKCDKVETFKNFIQLTDNFFGYNVFHKNSIIGIYTVALYGYIGNYIIKKNLREEWVRLIEEEFIVLCLASKIHLDNSILKAVFSEYISFLEDGIENGNEYIKYNMSFENLSKLYINLSGSCDDNSVSNYIQSVFRSHSAKILEMQPDQKKFLKDFINTIFNLGKSAFDNNNRNICLFVLSIFDHILEESQDTEILNLVSTHKYNLSLKAIYFNNDLAALFLPDYNKIIKESTSHETTKIVVTKYKELLYRTVIRKNNDLSLYFCNEINDLILFFSKEQKLEQIEFFNLYDYLLSFSVELGNEETFQLILHKYLDLIKSLDKEDRISIDLFNNIVETFDSASNKAIRDKQIDLCLSLNGAMADLLGKLNIVAKQKNLFVKSVEIIFQNGLKGIENDIDDVIRNASNHLGWVCKHAIDNNEREKVKFVLDKASSLFNICVEFEVNEKTVIFVGTLFIMLGGYSNSINNPLVANYIYNSIKTLKKISLLNKSKLIREHESVTWDKFMKNPKINIDNFWKKVK